MAKQYRRKRFERTMKMVIAGSAPLDMPEKRITEALEIYVLSLSKDLSDVSLLKLPVAGSVRAKPLPIPEGSNKLGDS